MRPAMRHAKKKLWLLKCIPVEGAKLWDVADGFVVQADTEEEARKLAAKEAGDEGPDVWISPKRSWCDEFPLEGEASKVILRDFNAG